MTTNYREIYLKILNEIEKTDNILNVSGGRGYGTGKTYPVAAVGVLQMLGPSHEEEEEENYKLKTVKISKAFKPKGKNNGKWSRKRK